LNNTADIFTKNPTEDIFQTPAVKLVKHIPNKAEMCHLTSANYEDLILENDQNDWIVVAKRKQQGNQTKRLVTVKQEGKLKQLPYKIKPPPNMSKKDWHKRPPATCESCGCNGHVSKDCYYHMREDRSKWKHIPYDKPGNKPLTRKEQKRILRMEDKFEKEALEISLGLQAYDSKLPLPDPIILQLELHVKPCSLCYEFGHTPMDVLSCVLYVLRQETVITSWLVPSEKIIHTTSLVRKTLLILKNQQIPTILILLQYHIS
jgi:hypothetical protein